MNDRPPVELVCFDLGGVLVQICRSWSEAADHVGVPDCMDFTDPAVADAVFALMHEFEVGRVERDLLVTRLVDLSSGYEPPQIEAIVPGWLKGQYAGAETLIERVGAAGLTTACLSNTNAWHWEVMGDAGQYPALQRLHHRLASHEVGSRKPDAPFYEALERAAGVAPEAIVFFDDLAANIDAAVQRGWIAHQITDDRDPIAQMAERLDALGVP